MNEFNASFIKSAANASDFLVTDKPIICVTGKSNVGKSSFINMLANRKKLAKTSNTPGRTRLVNYFDFGEFILVDLPGYGYAETSKAEKDKWAKSIEQFFDETKICLVISLFDIRHDPTKDDITMIKYLYAKVLPFAIVATKADKLAKTKIVQGARNVANKLAVGFNDVIATSSQTNLGRDKVIERINRAVELFYELDGETEESENED